MPEIRIIEVSSSNSDISSSVDEDQPDLHVSEIERIVKTHKEMQKKLTYQIMQLRSTSRMLINDDLDRVEADRADPDLRSQANTEEHKIENFQEIFRVFSYFRDSQIGLKDAKSDMDKVDQEYESLRYKLNDLEEKIIQRKHKRKQENYNCSCIVL